MRVLSHILLLLSLAMLVFPVSVYAQADGPAVVLDVQEIEIDDPIEGDAQDIKTETVPSEGTDTGETAEAEEGKEEGSHIKDMLQRAALSQSQLILERVGSLFFTSYEYQLIKEARKGYTARAPTEREIDKSQEEERPRKKGPRELTVGGIIYSSDNDWTVWLNGQKITPTRLPEEILDIIVRKDYIKLKWFDPNTNQIYPIKIKTHQRFNLDTRIFLPG